MPKYYDHTEEREGFTITLECLPEHELPDWYFQSEEEREKLLYDIENYHIKWFCAKVSAHKNGILLASTHLGGCCYDDVNDFLKNSGHYQDMVATVIIEAKQAIKDLNKWVV